MMQAWIPLAVLAAWGKAPPEPAPEGAAAAEPRCLSMSAWLEPRHY